MNENNTFGWELVALLLAGGGLTMLGGSIMVLSNKSPAAWSHIATATTKLLSRQ